MPKNLMTLDIATAAFDVYQEVYDIQPIQPVQGGAVLQVKGVTQEKIRKSYSAKKILLYQSKNRATKEWVDMKDSEGNVVPDPKTNKPKQTEVTARDFKCGDLSKEQIIKLLPGSGPWFAQVQPKNGKSSRTIEEWAEISFKTFVSKAQFYFASGDMDAVIKSMIYHMRDGKGADYQNGVLLKQVEAHPNTIKFINQVKQVLQIHIARVRGNINALAWKKSSATPTEPLWQPFQNGVKHWEFSNDKLGGLTICINDVWGYEIYLKDYQSDGFDFSATLFIDAYDHFGLDEADLKWYTSGDPFFSWFILQRWKGFNQKYKPFVTRIPIEVPIRGSLL